MKASNLRSRDQSNMEKISTWPKTVVCLTISLPLRGNDSCLCCESPFQTISIPELGVKSEAEAVADAPRSALPLEGAGFGNKGLNQGTHLAALMVPERPHRLELTLYNQIHSRVIINVFIRHSNSYQHVDRRNLEMIWSTRYTLLHEDSF